MSYETQMREQVETYLHKLEECEAAKVFADKARQHYENLHGELQGLQNGLSFVGANLPRRVFNIDNKAVIIQHVKMSEGRERFDVSVEPLL